MRNAARSNGRFGGILRDVQVSWTYLFVTNLQITAMRESKADGEVILKIKSALISIAMLISSSTAVGATNIIQDGAFQNSIGTGSNLTPWSDWASSGVSRFSAPNDIPGNYARLSWGTDLFQQFLAPAAGSYTLSFFVQNPMPYSTKMIIDVQQPLGAGWHLLDKVISLDPSTDFIFETFQVAFNRPTGDPSEFYFSNSYDYPDPSRGFQGTVNPQGTFLNVAEVSLVPSAAPEPATWSMMILGFFGIGSFMRRRNVAELETA
jgi:hypothetical protein